MEDIDWETYLEGYSIGNTDARDNYEDIEERPSYESLLTKKESLYDHLMWQLSLSAFDEQQRIIATEIIGNIDDAGYLQASPEEIAATLKADLEVVADVLDMVQQLDPAGIACKKSAGMPAAATRTARS